jgi:hypothetical protein
LLVVERTTFSNDGPEIRLAAPSPPSGSRHKRGRKIWDIAHKPPIREGGLLIIGDALVVETGAAFRGRLEIPWDSIRKAVIDDGSRWGYVATVCRFPVYDVRSSGLGSGVLVGPLWSKAAALLPPGCPVAALEPVPEQSPNLVLIFEPQISVPAQRMPNGRRPREADSIAGLLLRVEDPDAARAAIASRVEIGDIDHDDLEYLNRAAGLSRSGSGASGNGASGNRNTGNGRSAAHGSGDESSADAGERARAAGRSSS